MERPAKTARIAATNLYDKTIYLSHVGILLGGWSLGLFMAYFVLSLPFDFSGELLRAKALGIASVTTLSEYPKSKDVLAYFTILGFPVLVSITLWYFWSREWRMQLQGFFAGGQETENNKNTAWMFCLTGTILCILYLSFNINGFYTPGWNPTVGAWVFLGEDGVNLAWVQSILSGGVYGRDFYCLYGPLLIYPLALVMKLFGTSVVVERSYRYFLDLVAYGIIIFFLYRTIKSKTLFILFSISFLAVFPPFFSPSLNFTYLRFALGILPLLLLHLFFAGRKKYFLFLTGVVVAQSILFSQEAGLCSFIAVSLTYLIGDFSAQDRKTVTTNFFIILAGVVTSAAPFALYFLSKGALIAAIDSLFGSLKLTMLGFCCLPAPDFREFLSDPLGESLFFYGVIFFYSLVSIFLIPRLLLGQISRDTILKLSMLIFGILLFVVAVRRYGPVNVHKVFMPPVLLLFLFLDTAVQGTIKHERFFRTANAILVGVLLIPVFAFGAFVDDLQSNVDYFHSLQSSKGTFLTVGYTIPSLPRAGIFFDENTAASASLLNDFLTTNTAPGEYVYFFPNEAAYYFLFNRNNPTRFAVSPFAISAEQRRELIADLDKKKPAYLVYSRDTWRMDGIDENIQAPEIVDYIREAYEPYRDMGNILILKRKSI